jgi:hypothetical protein
VSEKTNIIWFFPNVSKFDLRFTEGQSLCKLKTKQNKTSKNPAAPTTVDAAFRIKREI